MGFRVYPTQQNGEFMILTVLCNHLTASCSSIQLGLGFKLQAQGPNVQEILVDLARQSLELLIIDKP